MNSMIMCDKKVSIKLKIYTGEYSYLNVKYKVLRAIKQVWLTVTTLVRTRLGLLACGMEAYISNTIPQHFCNTSIPLYFYFKSDAQLN